MLGLDGELILKGLEGIYRGEPSALHPALEAAFNSSGGHTHDGTTQGDGGPISKLFSNAITLGTNVNADVVLTFDATSNDGVLSWMEDEGYFQFSDDILFILLIEFSVSKTLRFIETFNSLRSSIA